MPNLRMLAPLVSLVLLAAGCASPPRDAHHAHPAPAAEPGAPLYGAALGSWGWPITTSSPDAQRYFDDGVRLMFGYARADARRSFAEARRLDPSCAMCWWGEAWSMGRYLNGAMSPADAPPAYAAATRAVELMGNATEVERALIVAMAARYEPEHTAAGRLRLDSAYAAAMDEAHRRHPDDLEVATLYADALMLLEPRRGVWSLEKPSVARILAVLERVLAADIGHPGACHAYIHATETTPVAGRAQTCADLLMTSIPGVSHINHMPSHTYNRVGRWGDAVASNLLAVETDRRAAAGTAVSIYAAHNLHMLLFSAAVDGQRRVAEDAARAFAEQVPDGASLHALVLQRFGRWPELLALTEPPRHALHRGLWVSARGHAHLRAGAADSAAAALAEVDSLATEHPELAFRGHPARVLLGVTGGILRGELLRGAGRLDDAIAAFAAAVELEDGLAYDEPEPLPFAARDWLGAALLEAGRAAEAERVYRDALADRPNNGWSLLGLERALAARGLDAGTAALREAIDSAWARADTPIEHSRF
jgi:tetratricopeptide (TPR) repeat protein